MRWSGHFSAPDAVEVIPGLHMGAAPGTRAARMLARTGITHAIDLRADAAGGMSSWPVGVKLLHCPFSEYEAPTLGQLQAVSGQAARLIEQGDTVYVHCRAGVQRAPMVACAVLLEMGWTLAQAYALVSSRRSVASLSDGQIAVLQQLEAVRHIDVAHNSLPRGGGPA